MGHWSGSPRRFGAHGTPGCGLCRCRLVAPQGGGVKNGGGGLVLCVRGLWPWRAGRAGALHAARQGLSLRESERQVRCS
ncbi:hypothetical protein CSE45_1953 [Citreicella sp. SE45]|nr:hypothetical protein CSE45_1953 [Citreicella sp. SE45]